MRDTIKLILLLFLLINNTEIISQNNNTNYRLTIGANAGIGKLVEKSPTEFGSNFEKYFNDFRSGTSFGASAYYNFNKYLSSGINFKLFKTKIDAENITIYFWGIPVVMSAFNNAQILSLTPVVRGNYPIINSKLLVSAFAGPSYLRYKNYGKNLNETNTYKGDGVGLNTGLILTYNIYKNISLSVTGEYYHIKLDKVIDQNQEEVDVGLIKRYNLDNISRLDFTFGIVYNFIKAK